MLSLFLITCFSSALSVFSIASEESKNTEIEKEQFHQGFFVPAVIYLGKPEVSNLSTEKTENSNQQEFIIVKS